MATNQELIDYYKDLLIIQYRNKPKARATIDALVKNVIMNQLGQQLYDAFDVDQAEGVQLDVIGKYVGVSRYNNGFSGPVTLNDSDFKALINFASIKNNAPSSLGEIQKLINDYFGEDILLFDTQNMQMSYMIDSSLGSVELVQVIVVEDLLPVPMGVQLTSIIYGTPIDQFYGFQTYDFGPFNVTPLNNYDSYDMSSPWLSYSNSLELS